MDKGVSQFSFHPETERINVLTMFCPMFFKPYHSRNLQANHYSVVSIKGYEDGLRFEVCFFVFVFINDAVDVICCFVKASKQSGNYTQSSRSCV